MRFNSVNIFYTLVAVAFLSVSTYLVIKNNLDKKVSYNQDIRPIINSKCITCHGGVKKSSGLSFLFREEALDTTESGLPAIIPGDAENSEVYKRLVHHDPEMRMPLEAEPLSKKEIELIKDWINQGAEWETHWAYTPPSRALTPPETKHQQLVSNNIDNFIFSKLDEKGLSPAPVASQEVLLRRLYLDLIGLPPTPAEAQEFLDDQRPDAYEKLVNKLLDSPHFGERWAAMWLDLARYADTKGYEKDLNRSIWKYRDWVIQAFNQDMPYDQFTVEQLAGDLLPQPSQDQLIATAFHRNTMANDEGGTDNEEFRVAAVVERVGTTFEVWQGTTMACVQCHSHPYDPIRHEEFYQFMAFFNNTEDKDIYNEQPKLFTYEGEDAQKVDNILTWLKNHLRDEDKARLSGERFLHQEKEDILYQLGYRHVEAEEYQGSSKLIELMAPDQDVVWQVQDSSWIMFEEIDLTDVEQISFRCATAISGGYIDVRLDSVDGKKIGQTEITTTGQWRGWSGSKPEDELWKIFTTPIIKTNGKHDVYYQFRKNKDLTQHLFHLDWMYYHEKKPAKAAYDQNFNQKLKQLAAIKPMFTPIMQDLPPRKSRKTYVFERGNWMVEGEEVIADVPDILGEIPTDEPTNRLGMAQWLVSTENPLTARVMVNRVWAQIFGTGIIETMEEFGSQGEPPSHASLLDWLAVRFMDEYQWSMKLLIKQIVMSAAYQQSSVATPEKIEKDPKNRLVSRGPRVRLSAEQVRDQVLAVSGLINKEMYGPSIKPPRPDVSTNGWGSWKADTGKAQYRRSLYVFTKRTSPHPMLITFDGTSRNVCTSRRIRTNTPLQALTLLNDSTFFAAAEHLADYMASVDTEVEVCLKRGYERVMFQPPSKKKLKALRQLYEEAYERYNKKELVHSVAFSENEAAKHKALSLVANALLNLDEFVTKN
ncbi:hypothetical protein OKW21_001675 [Catalinimonas alkaloidigena]|uniref:DUF1553 domain-containing protein n=1 Tax=Catalinimonas alkaloidigena TaxID=1075417 RepID=UPI0024057E58|nr:DUF1553 domain-containing protein [Catalinimonas alkaloidigena]MDF9796412.1 hypothetical protein [Catalinimonas alkaloidigena]